jgi:F0F1-type ATP synthase assembly protein I
MPFNRPIPDAKPRSKPSTAIQGLVQAEKLMQIALLLPSSAFIGWLAGAWLDKHFHQSWIGIAGCVFGGISGLVYVVRLALASVGDSANGAGTENGNGKGSPGKP